MGCSSFISNFSFLLGLPEFSKLAADILYNGNSCGHGAQCATCGLSFSNVSKHVVKCKPVGDALGQEIVRVLAAVLMGN